MDAPPLLNSLPEDVASYRQLLDAVDAFVYACDRNGCYIFANRQVLDLLGGPTLKLDAVLGRRFTDFVDIDAEGGLRETDRRVIEQGEVVALEEENLIHATGEMRVYWSVKRPLRDAFGAITGLLGISYDITEKKRLAQQVQRQKAMLDTVLDNINALVYLKNRERRFLYANRRTAEVFGRPAEAIIGRLDSELMPPEAADRFWEKDQRIFATGEKVVGEEALTMADGTERHYWSVVAPCTTPDGDDAIIGLSTDITELYLLKEELQQQARTDSLTGIANRRHFFAEAGRLFKTHPPEQPLALIAIDLDHFKRINDIHGHLVGDAVLRDFAQCCGGRLRLQDLFARTGGEEFCILLPNTGLAEAEALAERLRTQVHASCKVSEQGLAISISLGVAAAAPQDANFLDLFRRADRALYQAKEAGRNCLRVAS